MEVPPEIPSLNKLARHRQRRRARRRKKIERCVRETIRNAVATASADALQGADDALATLRMLQQIDLSAIIARDKGGGGGGAAAGRGNAHLPRLRLPVATRPSLQPSASFLNASGATTSLRRPVLVRSSSSPGHMKLMLPQQRHEPFSTSSSALLRRSLRESREKLARRREEKAVRLRALLLPKAM